MKRRMFYFAGIIVLVAVLAVAQLADAGYFKKVKRLGKSLVATKNELSSGSQKVKDAIARRMGKIYDKTLTNNSVTGEWGTRTTCEDPKSVTCVKGKDDYANCMNQSKNYYYRLVADHLEKKLGDGQNLFDFQRKDLQEDIAAVKGAIETGRVIDPDPEYPNRWMLQMSREERAQINRLNSKYIQEVYQDCEARFGVMTQYK